jgi:CheY-like chemotaxis protein
VLVADSQPELREVLGHLLRDASYVPAFAADAMQLIRAVAHTPPDVLVLDADLACLDGVRALDVVRAMSGHLPIVVLSCLSEPALDVAAERAGVVAILRKPFRNADLLDAIAKGLTALPQPQR